jgi:hypothetical protein
MRACERRDDAARHGLPDAEGIADRKHEIADLHRVRIADRHGRENRRLPVIDLQHREIERLSSLSSTLLDANSRPSASCDPDITSAALLMTWLIGHHDAASVRYHAPRSPAMTAFSVRFRTTTKLAAEELLEEGIAGEGVQPLDDALGVDIYHSSGCLLDQRREGQLDLRLAFRHRLLCLRMGRDGLKEQKGGKTGRQAHSNGQHVIPRFELSSRFVAPQARKERWLNEDRRGRHDVCAAR